jgi:hypothetical protein
VDVLINDAGIMLQQVAELARTRRLASIRAEFKAKLASVSDEGPADKNAPGAPHSSIGRRAYRTRD